MFVPFSSGNGDESQRADRYTAGRFKAHVKASPSKLRGPAQFSSSLDIGDRVQHSKPGSSSSNGRSTTQGPHQRFTQPGVRAQMKQRRERGVSISEPGAAEKGWWYSLMRPSRSRVESWLGTWWKRWSILVLVPCCVVWLWVATPFPVADPYKPELGFHWPRTPWSSAPSVSIPSRNFTSLLFSLTQESALTTTASNGTNPEGQLEQLPLDVNFFFFLFFYYGLYLHVALLFMTKLFDLYRLNWWPKRIGGKASYFFFWATALCIGWSSHHFDLVGRIKKFLGREGSDQAGGLDWERKTFWIVLTFATMGCPAIVCFSVLKRDKRHQYRKSLTPHQRTFLERQLTGRIPASYLRFLWFMAVLGIAMFALIAGQAYTSVYLSTLPHTSLDAAMWVYSWVGTTTCLGIVSTSILERKVRSRGLLYLFRYFSALVYFVFYRNLFARMRSLFILVQFVSTLVNIILYPLQMSAVFHRFLVFIRGYDKSLPEHRESLAIGLHAKSVAQNVSMVAFLYALSKTIWLSRDLEDLSLTQFLSLSRFLLTPRGYAAILHYGPNSVVYPFFKFGNADDDYTFSLTFTASSAIWASEIITSVTTNAICRWGFSMDINGVGLDVMRDYPDLVPACCVASAHVLMNILMFLLKTGTNTDACDA
ncbi:Major facilitator superfamily domain, general substrate transporter [Phaffia rhodozyma]|uniref:Major facilitator superfamily domain, general substrate transporter n=1 Tax=Phaffia rhodozyma TaxID=264483 RepID=A0A0F7SQG5_PHARH|nr:Major facilitator superfamily domain, general substrate transporter [Phaffia rhodozyma]